MLNPTKIILHCSATEDSESKSWDAIKRYHVEEKGWKDIGYHFGIERVGDDIKLYRGRPHWMRGAHCRADGRNYDSLGLCVVGKFDEDPPSPEVYAATLRVLRELCYYFWIDIDDVYGHREFEDGKTCPGKMWNLDKLRDDLRYVVPAPESNTGVVIGRFE